MARKNPRYYRTVDLARAAGVHPNTVRLYEKWGLIPAPERSKAGYRLFTRLHLDLMRLARTVIQLRYPGSHPLVSSIIQKACAKDFKGALGLAKVALTRVRNERAKAEVAIAVVERWVAGREANAAVDEPHWCDITVDLARTKSSPRSHVRAALDDADRFPLRIGQVAALLEITPNALRNWERNGLIEAPREPNGYRAYGPPDIERLRVIRALRAARYGMMAILRMLTVIDAGEDAQIRETLDTPDPGEGIWYATDRWLTTLSEQEKRAQDVVALLEELIERAEF